MQIITDVTDAGIILLGSPGTTVSNNTISNPTRRMQGGIVLADFDPYAGDYSGVVIEDNKIESTEMLKVGISGGSAAWYGLEQQERLLANATIRRNVLSGGAMGYGIVLSGYA